MKSFKSLMLEFFQIILENRIERIKTMNPIIDSSHDTLAQHRDSSAIIDHFAQNADPTPNKIHTQWIVNKYKNRDFRQEDAGRIRTALSHFETHKSKLDKKDINQYKTLSDVETAVQPHIGTAASIKQQKKEIKAEGADTIFKEGGVTVRHLKTEDAAKFYGKGTKWCTAAENDSMFSHYNEHGPLYMIQTPDNRKYQFHFESNQFMDEQDKRINLSDLVQKHPQLTKVKEFQGTDTKGKQKPFALKGDVSSEEIHDILINKNNPKKYSKTDVIQHPKTSAETLHQLFHRDFTNLDSNVHNLIPDNMSAIATHANLGQNTIRDMHKAIKKSPSDYYHFRSLYSNPNTPKSIRDDAFNIAKTNEFRDSKRYIRDALAANPNLESDEIDNHIDEGNYRVLDAKNFNNDHINKVINQYAGDGNNVPKVTNSVIWNLLTKKNITSDQVDTIHNAAIQKNDKTSAENALAHPKLSTHILDQFVDRVASSSKSADDIKTHRDASGALLSPNLTKEHLDKMVHSGYQFNESEAAPLVKNKHIDSSHLRKLITTSRSMGVKAAALQHKNTPKDIIDEYASNYKSSYYDRNIAVNPSLSKENIHTMLSNRHHVPNDITELLLWHPNADSSHVDTAINRGHKRAALQSPHLSEKHIDDIVNHAGAVGDVPPDIIDSVRIRAHMHIQAADDAVDALNHKNATMANIKNAMGSKNIAVRGATYRSPHMTEDMLMTAAKDNEAMTGPPYAYSNVGNHANSSTKVLHTMLDHNKGYDEGTSSMINFVAGSHHADESIHNKILDHNEEYARKLNDTSDEEVHAFRLHNYAYHVNSVTKAIASHPNTTPEVLDRAHDALMKTYNNTPRKDHHKVRQALTAIFLHNNLPAEIATKARDSYLKVGEDSRPKSNPDDDIPF